MAEVEVTLDGVRAEVRALEGQFSDFGTRISTEIKDLGRYIRESNQATEQRLNLQQDKTDQRFDMIARGQSEAASKSYSNIWIIIGIAASTVIGIASLGATFWSLTKAPIDSHFSDLDHTTEKTNDRLENQYVPRSEVKVTTDLAVANNARINALEVENATDVANIANFRASLKAVDDDVERLRASIVPRPENENRFTDLQERIDKLFDRLNIVQQNLADGNSVGDRMNELRSELQALINKFIVTGQPPIYKASPSVQPDAAPR